MNLPAKTTPRLEVRRVLPASPEAVFRAWTQPEQLKQWWGQNDDFTTPIAEVDLRVGGRYRLGMQPPDSSQVYTVGGQFREVEPPRKLVYTWQWESEEGDSAEMLVTVAFEDHPTGTELILIHERLPDEDSKEQHAVGWALCLDQFAKLFSAK